MRASTQEVKALVAEFELLEPRQHAPTLLRQLMLNNDALARWVSATAHNEGAFETRPDKMLHFLLEQCLSVLRRHNRGRAPRFARERIERILSKTASRLALRCEIEEYAFWDESLREDVENRRLFGMRERLAQKVGPTLIEAFKRCGYRMAESKWVDVDNEFEISIAANPRIRRVLHKTWSDNRKWSAMSCNTQIVVKHDWHKVVGAERAVYSHGLNSRLVLDLDLVPPAQACVVEPGPGFELWAKWVPYVEDKL